MSKVAFIGLGIMGYPMAGHLQKGGHEVAVYNRTTARAEKWLDEHKGSFASSPKVAAEGADFVFSCVGNDDDVRSVILGDAGAFAGMKPDSILIDNTTVSAVLAREITASGNERGVHVLDAPVSGGQAGAENGVLTVMCGGEMAPFERAEPVMQCYARGVTLMGPAGSGQLTKMVNQLCIAGLLQGLSEGMNFAVKAGLNVETVIDVVSKGAAQTWQMENRASTMCRGEFNFGFAVDWMRKDLAICLEEAELNGARLPVAALINQFYAQVKARKGGRWDTSSLMHLLAND
jgi:3-hydroxyisobutyrate dehydrogenase